MNHPEIDQQITFIYTNNLQKSAEFYESIMGFNLWRDQGSCRIYHIHGSSYLGICQTGSSAKGIISTDSEQTNIIITIVTQKVDEWYETLRQRGVQFEKPPEENSTYQIYHCFLRDPNGYLIEIQRFMI